MTHKTFIFTGILILVSMVSFANCWPYQFGQLATDWYRGMAIPTLSSYYYTFGKPMSYVGECHPKNQYIFAWEDGFYIWGIYGGNNVNQCSYTACPQPYLNPNERIVFAVVEKGNAGTKFLIDSSVWDSSGFGYFNMDLTSGVVHEAGILSAPKVKIEGSVIVRGNSAYTLEIPVPRGGVYSDPSIDPKTLIAGIAIYGKYSQEQPTDLRPEEFQFLKAIPVDLSTYSSVKTLTIETEVSMAQYTSTGKPYFAYTLILNDGSDLPLQNKPVLPLLSPAVTPAQGIVVREMALNKDELFPSSDDISVVEEQTPVNGVKAVRMGNLVKVEFKVNAENAKIEVYSSYDLTNWAPLTVENFRAKGEFSFWHEVELDSEIGVFYEIRLKDAENNNEIYTIRTRAR